MIYLIIWTFISPIVLWGFFLAVMSLKRQKRIAPLKGIVLYLGSFILALGYLVDAYVNIFVMTLVLFELPEELTVTSRLKRHIKINNTWGQKVAIWHKPLLDPFDPDGSHIS